MPINKPGNDVYRVTASSNSPFETGACTISCWMNCTAFNTSTNHLFSCLTASVRGWLLRYNDPSNIIEFGYVDSGNANKGGSRALTATTDTWYFIFGGVDASGNIVVGFDTTETTSSDVAPIGSGSAGTATMCHQPAFGVGNGHLGDIADFRFYNRLLSLEERRRLYYSRGKDGIIDGLVSRVKCFDAEPGQGVGSQAPLDIGSAGLTWSQSGIIGSPLIYSSGQGLARRRLSF